MPDEGRGALVHAAVAKDLIAYRSAVQSNDVRRAREADVLVP
jgi:hypothetical protein